MAPDPTTEMVNKLNDVYNVMYQIQLILAQQLKGETQRGKVETAGQGVITVSGQQNGITLNSTYYHDIVLKLAAGTSTPTKVYVTLSTEQSQDPAVFQLSSNGVSRVRMCGVRALQIYTDSTLTNGQKIFVTFIGYDAPKKIEIDATNDGGDAT